jgi:hypothetical protein
MEQEEDAYYSITDYSASPTRLLVSIGETIGEQSTRVVMLEPNRVYNVYAAPADYYSPSIHTMSMVFEVPDGYRVHLDNWHVARYEVYGEYANFKLQVTDTQVRDIGEVSELTIEDNRLAKMSLGLGRLVNGRAMSDLFLVADISAGPEAATAYASYFVSRPYGDVWISEDLPTVQQIKKRDVVVDMRRESGENYSSMTICYYRTTDIDSGTLASDASVVTFGTADPVVKVEIYEYYQLFVIVDIQRNETEQIQYIVTNYESGAGLNVT